MQRRGWLVNHRKTEDLERYQGQNRLELEDRRVVTSMGTLGKLVTQQLTKTVFPENLASSGCPG